MDPLEALRFHLVGYGCTTCIGNSGPLAEPIAEAIEANDSSRVAVLSGNRNFEGRIHPLARASYLASPPLVVAFALAGRIDIDLTTEPIGTRRDGKPVMLADLWPSPEGSPAWCQSGERRRLRATTHRSSTATTAGATCRCRRGPLRVGSASTYVARPAVLRRPRRGARRSTRHRRRARAGRPGRQRDDRPHLAGGLDRRTSPAGEWLVAHGVEPRDFNSYGSRRGHHEVMMRGTFANIRLRNLLTPDAEGNVTEHLPSGERMSIFDAADALRAEGRRWSS